MTLVCEICQTPIYTREYVGVKEPVHGTLGHRTRFYHLQCYVQRMEEVKV